MLSLRRDDGSPPQRAGRRLCIEGRFGFPAKRRYRSVFGGEHGSTLIIERQWESLAAMEAAFDKALADPEWLALNAEGGAIIESNRQELYMALP